MNIDEYIQYFGQLGNNDYLKVHFQRYYRTKQSAYKEWPWDTAEILDVGAHWLHQSVAYAVDGHHVTAADFSLTLENPAVQKLAAKHNIDLLIYSDLSSESVFDQIEDDAIDVILFTEIIEHITFNPVAMWKALYRILRPGGKIIVTTPNFYDIASLVRTVSRIVTGSGAGISIADILSKHTNAPHWKEFSSRELKAYFELLSADFIVRGRSYFSYAKETGQLNWKGRLVHNLKDAIPFLRKCIYVEIFLPRKVSGISIDASW